MILEQVTGKRYSLLIALITLCALALRVAWLADSPPNSDSIGSAATAYDYMLNGKAGGTMWHHPKLRNIVLFFSLSLLGGTVWGLHLPSIIMGTLSVPLMGTVIKRVTDSSLAALIGAFLLAADSVHIDFSRQAIQEVYMPFFTLLGIWLVLLYRDEGRRWFLVFAGCAFGLGLAGKWYVLFPLMVTLAYMAWHLRAGERKTEYREMMFLVCSLTLLPLSVYLLTYLPWILHRGYGLADLLELHRLMLRESTTHQGFNPLITGNDSKPYLWFVRPAGFADFVMQGSRPVIFVAVTNPLVWMATFPALCLTAYEAYKKRNGQLFFIPALFVFSYIPLVSVQRPIWVHTALAVAPFAFMLVAYSIVILVRKYRRGGLWLLIYAASVILASVPLYMLVIGKGHDTSLLRPIAELYRPEIERQRMLQP